MNPINTIGDVIRHVGGVGNELGALNAPKSYFFGLDMQFLTTIADNGTADAEEVNYSDSVFVVQRFRAHFYDPANDDPIALDPSATAASNTNLFLGNILVQFSSGSQLWSKRPRPLAFYLGDGLGDVPMHYPVVGPSVPLRASLINQTGGNIRGYIGFEGKRMHTR